MQKYQCSLLALLIASAPAAFAQEQTTQDPPSVEVKDIRNPELRSYRNIMAGMNAFEEHHNLAPAAPELRFRLRPKRGQPPLEKGEALTVRIKGNGDPVIIPVAPDNTFTVPRMQALLDDDADMVLNRKKGLVEGLPAVRTPGLPENVRRLGDVRLECQVLIAIGKKEMGFLMRAALTTVMLSGNWCEKKNAEFWFSGGHPLESAVLREGERTAEVKVKEWSYLAPLGDETWSNDALIEFKYGPEPAATAGAAP
ncbi:hypothetical protein AB4Z19_13575 [Pseudoduganella sp. RAF19]|uniref:hypothetical protein n=1 Tax=Pseudoduganella sp. RAF19 TaxID=3233052 RepID=UPI003F95D5C4